MLVAAAADTPIDGAGLPRRTSCSRPAPAPTSTGGKGLSVTAADFLDARASFAGRGTQISLAAYGTYDGSDNGRAAGDLRRLHRRAERRSRPASLGRRPAVPVPDDFNGDARYAYVQGTSMAAPMVSAVAALVRHLNPDLTGGRDRPPDQGRPRAVRAGTGWTPDLGWGILDAGAALTPRRGRSTAARRSRRSAAWPRRTHHTRLTLRWRGGDQPRAGRVRGAGVARFELWRALDGRRPRKLLSTTTRRSRVKLPARPTGTTSSPIAVDKAGNRELAPRLRRRARSASRGASAPRAGARPFGRRRRRRPAGRAQRDELGERRLDPVGDRPMSGSAS